jgi:hypothetical protein
MPVITVNQETLEQQKESLKKARDRAKAYRYEQEEKDLSGILAMVNQFTLGNDEVKVEIQKD